MTTRRDKQGMTLIEVLLATVILGFGLTAIMVALSQCLGLMKLSKEYLDAQWVLSLGELSHPIRETRDVEEDVPVEPVSLDEELPKDMQDRRYMYEREVEEKEDDPDIVDDGLYVVHSYVRWGGSRRSSTKDVNVEKITRLVLQKK